ncbi:MAG: TRAP transporter small permease subunit [Pseudomonadota bacterium]|nr:TRAP transporter small permease subunit [Pseudomonadota bacterium]
MSNAATAAPTGFAVVFDRVLTAFVMLLLSSLALIILYAVVCRKLGVSLVWYDEVASVMLAWLTYYGAALAALKRAHIGFPGLVNTLAPRWRVAAVWFAEICVIGFFAVLAWFGVDVLVILHGDTLVSLPWVPTRFTQSVIPIGAVLFIVAQLLSLPEVLRQARGAGLVDHEQLAVNEPALS